MEPLLGLLIQIIVVGLIFYLLFWAIGRIGLPEPFNKVAIVIVVLLCVIYLLNILLGLSGGGIRLWR